MLEKTWVGFENVVVHDLVALKVLKVIFLVVCMFSMITLLLASLPLISFLCLLYSIS